MQTKATKLCNLLCVLLLWALFVFHFLPAWDFGGECLSMLDYIWFPLDHEDLTAHFAAQYDGFRVEELVFTSAACWILPIVAVVLLIRDSESSLPALCGLAGGVIVMIGMLTHPVYRISHALTPYLVVAVAVSAVSLAVLLPHALHTLRLVRKK